MFKINLKSNIAFYFVYDKNWLGGMYYKKHLICALVNNDVKNIIVFTDSNSVSMIKELLKDLPISIVRYDIEIPSYLWRIEEICRRRFDISIYGYLKYNLRNIKVFDFKPMGIIRNIRLKNRIYWIPDLQDKYLPQLFSESQVISKNNRYKYLSKYARHIVLSSNDSKMSLLKFYPKSIRSDLKLSLLRFSVYHPELGNEFEKEILRINGLQNINYFIVSNQFMLHKNHQVVFRALKKYIDDGSKFGIIRVIMTGKQLDPRDEKYFDSLLKIVEDLKINDFVTFTGEINRNEQLVLLKNAKAIIQPSLFEGWNSTVEDGKLLNQCLICSNISIHLEQLEDYNALFFNPTDENELLVKLEQILEFGCKIDYNYNLQRKDFEKQLLDIFK
jgi:glycosyltransferase involved in cell wall biosynthesis